MRVRASSHFGASYVGVALSVMVVCRPAPAIGEYIWQACQRMAHASIPYFWKGTPKPIADLKDFTIGRRLGSGGQGTAYLGFGVDAKGRTVPVIIKEAHDALSDGGESEAALEKEYQNYKKLRPNDVHWDDSERSPRLIMRLVPRSDREPNEPADDLEKLVANNPRLLTPEFVRSLQDSVLDDIDTFHSQNLVHGDIKAPNILVTQLKGSRFLAMIRGSRTKGSGKTIDMATMVEDGSAAPVGTVTRWSPQRWRDRKASKADDLYALGIEFLLTEYPGVLSEGSPYSMKRFLGQQPIRTLKRIPDNSDKIKAERALAHLTQLKSTTAIYRKLRELSDKKDPTEFRDYYAKLWAEAYEAADENRKVDLVVELFFMPKLGPEIYKRLPDGMRRAVVFDGLDGKQDITRDNLLPYPIGWHPEMTPMINEFLRNPLVARDPAVQSLLN